MISQKTKRYALIALIGAGSFVFGYLVTFYIFQVIDDYLPVKVSLLAFSATAVFIGLFPVIFYLMRTMRSFLLVAQTTIIITIIYTGSLLVALECRPILLKLWVENILIGTDWGRVFLDTIHVHIFDIFYYGLWSVFFGIFVLVFASARKWDILLIVGLFFLVLVISMSVPNTLGLDGMKHETLRRGIFGVFFSSLVSHFLISKGSWRLSFLNLPSEQQQDENS